jgi:ATP-dependent Clp protease protease subunit
VEKVARDTDRDKFLSAEEAKTFGLVDQVVVSRKEIASLPEKSSVTP